MNTENKLVVARGERDWGIDTMGEREWGVKSSSYGVNKLYKGHSTGASGVGQSFKHQPPCSGGSLLLPMLLGSCPQLKLSEINIFF